MVVTFVYEHLYPHLWQDGLYQALRILNTTFDIKYCNLAKDKLEPEGIILGWGAFGSRVDKEIVNLPYKKALLIGGNAVPPHDGYDMYFYETEWYRDTLGKRPKTHAFGVNTTIYRPKDIPKMYDYLSVGSFSYWKRHINILKFKGNKAVIGEIQKHNLDESMDIVFDLVSQGVMVSDMVDPYLLANYYNMAENVYIGANVIGGGERAVLEARACKTNVIVEDDNPKLMNLLNCEVYDEYYYARAIEKGIRLIT